MQRQQWPPAVHSCCLQMYIAVKVGPACNPAAFRVEGEGWRLYFSREALVMLLEMVLLPKMPENLQKKLDGVERRYMKNGVLGGCVRFALFVV